ncbi:MAG: hypothetical protein PHT58_01685 [Eubacteriales bacterium]|nr:hypothetical protein [Eubacteriales bacterium]
MKKGLKAVIIALCCILAVSGGIFAYVKLTPQSPVNVVSAGNWMLYYMPNQSYLYGFVTSDAASSIYKSSDRKIIEVCVNQGDTVQIGDPLVRYDATMDGLRLEEKRLEREKLYNTLQGEYKQYERYARTPYPRTLPTATPSPTDMVTGAAMRQSEPSSGVQLSINTHRDLSTPTGGDGSQATPYIFEVNDGDAVTTAFLAQLRQKAIDEQRTVWVVLQGAATKIYINATADDELSFMVEADDPNPHSADLDTIRSGNGSEGDPFVFNFCSKAVVDAEFISSMLELASAQTHSIFVKLTASGFTVAVRFNADDTLSFALTLTPSSPTPTAEPSTTPTAEPSDTVEPSQSPEVTPVPGGGGMSREEREAYAREIAKGIREKEVLYQQLSLDIRKLELSGIDGIVYSTMEGTVSTINDPSSVSDGDLIVEVRGGSGLHVEAIIGEMELSKYPVGSELTGYSYDSGSNVTVRVSSVSTMPVTTNYSNGGNSNSSGYLMIMEVVGEETVSNGAYIEFSGYTPLSEEGTVYLHEAYIIEVDGEDYIFVMQQDVVERVKVKTGKRVDQYIELIDCDLTVDDYIAFPYDKYCKDGAPAKVQSESSSYGW